ncbi:DUF3397 domain-containing protein [Alteribacillus iranensis]|uniref:DUF3397 domain-containing protein n=1 Tax=Alteribacillus iranensis TaxID=930128 RepID=A0A1I2AC91_9BACI|nr:DUF3397 domain-containing protein [Alteribacillus iranensis]SFE41158.1 Protein of unknown function [Alteribacillus iranensis]
MSSFFVFILATMISIPFLAWYGVYIVTVKWTKQKGKAVRLAADTSTLLFILSVHFLILAIWGKSMFWFLILIVLAIAIVFTILHYRSHEEVEFLKLMKGIWRFTFFLFCSAYVVLFIYGMISYLLSAFLA